MGYSTQFEGELKFTREMTSSELAKLNVFLGADCREHPEWIGLDEEMSYVDLTITEDFLGIQWDGSEKTYHLDRIVRMLIDNMRQEVPDFGLKGTLSAQGEDVDDRWTLTVKDGEISVTKTPIRGRIVECPNCEHSFEVARDEDDTV